jgi:hypothetical protein
MKSIKTLGRVVLSALMAMAILSASSAMAESTALCKVDQNPCEAANQLSSVHEESVGKAKLLTSIGTTECNVSFSGTISTKLANPLVISGEFKYKNCLLGSEKCTATEENGPSEIKVLKEGHETSKVTGEGLVHVVCTAFIDCSYNGTNLVGTGKGPLLSVESNPNGEVTLSEQATTKEAGGFLCPKSSKLDITMVPAGETLTVCEKVEDAPKKAYITG